MRPKISSLSPVEKSILSALFFLQPVNVTRLRELIRQASNITTTGLADTIRDGLEHLKKSGFLFSEIESGYPRFSMKLSTAELFELGTTVQFSDVLSARHGDLLEHDWHIYTERERSEMEFLASTVLGGCILIADENMFTRIQEYLSKIIGIGADRITTKAWELTLGRSDAFPGRLTSRFFRSAFPFMSWNSTLRGGSHRALLGSIHTFCKDNRIPAELFDSYIMFLLWHGRREELERLAETSSSELAETAFEICKGNWKKAADHFPKYLLHNEENNVLLIITALLALAIQKGPEEKAVQLRKMLKTQLQAVRLPGQDELLRYLTIFHDTARQNQLLSDVIIDTAYHGSNLPFISMLQLLCIAKHKQEIPMAAQDLNKFRKLAEHLEKQGQDFTACQVWNALFCIVPDDESIAEKTTRFNESHILTRITEQDSKLTNWQIALEALQDVIMPQGNDPENKKHFIWELTVGKSYGDTTDELFAITPVLVPANKGNNAAGRAVSMTKFRMREFDRYLTEDERKIRESIPSNSLNVQIPLTAIRYLENNPRVVLKYSKDDRKNITVREGKNTIHTYRTQARGNGCHLSLKYLWREKQDDTVFVYYGKDGALYYVLNTPENQKLSEIFLKFGTEGSLYFPQDQVKQLVHTLEPFAGKFHVEGELQKEIFAVLPRIPGQIRLRMRLSRNASGMKFELVNKMFGDIPESIVTPGEGAEQTVILHNNEYHVICRDLTAERDAAEKIGAIIPCPMEEDSFCWNIQDPGEILETLELLRAERIPLDWLQGDVLRVVNAQSAQFRESVTGSGEWFTVGGEIKTDDDAVIPLMELLKKMPERHGEFVELSDHSYLRLTERLAKQLDALYAASMVKKDSLRISPAAVPMLCDVFDGSLGSFLSKQAEDLRKVFARKVKLPAGFQGKLRPYQLDGFEYLVRMTDCKLGCCLADDMGLGKTIQILALLQYKAADGPSLVVAPASVCRTWESEAKRFAPALRITIMGTRDRAELVGSAKAGDVIVTSYGLLVSESELFAGKDWNAVILDEAQSVKNNAAKRSHAVKGLHAKIRITATGTPMENRLSELWSIFDFLNPGMLDSEKNFTDKFCHTEEGIESLRKLVSPLILRRMKKDVLDDLPAKEEITISVELPKAERDLYEALRRNALMKIAAGDKDSRFSILSHLTKLRRACCHPALVNPDVARDMEGAKLNAIMELAEELRENGHRTLIFSQYVGFLNILQEAFRKQEYSYLYLDGATPADERAELVRKFQAEQADFFLISLKAGGTGLTLTAANYVIIADPWWNPAVEDQAADRVYRIGQKNPVTVYRMMTAGTVEEKVVAMHVHKRKLAEDVLSGANTSAISLETLLSLFEA